SKPTSSESFPVLATKDHTAFTATGWTDFEEGAVEGNPAFPLSPTIQGRDWSQSQLSAVASDDLLLISKRRRLAAIENATGQTRWTWELGYSLHPNPIHPLLCGSKVFARTLTSPQRYGLACLDKNSGRPFWVRDCEDNIAGDPQWIHGRLYVLTIRS